MCALGGGHLSNPPAPGKWNWKWSHLIVVWLWDPVDYSPPGSSIHGILQARILEWVAIPFYRGSSQPRDRTTLQADALTPEPPGQPKSVLQFNSVLTLSTWRWHQSPQFSPTWTVRRPRALEGFPGGSMGEEPACDAEDAGSILGSESSLEEGNDKPLQYSSLENPMDRRAWQTTVHGAIKNWIWLQQRMRWRMASPTRWTWVWVNSGSWWWRGKPDVLRFMGSRHKESDTTERLNWTELKHACTTALVVTLLTHPVSFRNIYYMLVTFPELWGLWSVLWRTWRLSGINQGFCVGFFFLVLKKIFFSL